MYAQQGDWLVVEQANVDHAARRGHEALVFPGPDAHVVTQDELGVAGARASTRAADVQREIAEHRRRS
ncbi:MAG: hypothetical protein GEV28_15915 [Actinophytocola sp.]|nr:hypothetical protein [Actinophytocola sp.]